VAGEGASMRDELWKAVTETITCPLKQAENEDVNAANVECL